MSPIAREYCQRYGIQRITLQLQSGVVEAAEQVCHLDLEFNAGYKVQFKLQDRLASLGEKFHSIDGEGRVKMLPGAAAGDLEAELEFFFSSIEGRLKRILHEEDVQSIEYLGNTFILNGKTVFDVVEDDDGKLIIAMHRGEDRTRAMLLASSLLDGLYDGSIRLVE